jgi:uncharacterized membrane protein YeaQ/YmgE (transglycosylase-associated protein family)
MGIIVYLLIGLVAGALAGFFVKGRGFGVIGDTVIGLIGGVIGGVVFDSLGLPSNNGIISSVVVSLVGAILLLMVVKAFVVKRTEV